MSVEVERKFLFNDDTLKTLEEIAVCIAQRQFHDQYFDTPQFHLTLKDMWLRNRKGYWELKCPTAGDRQTEETSGEQSKTVALCSRYKEITNLPDIQLKLKEVIKDVYENMDAPQEQKAMMTETFQQAAAAQHGLERPEGKYAQEDESWLRKMNLVSFAAFTTVRRSFTLEEGVQIDLDQADFGYHVGEIEVLIPEGGDLQSALEKIERTAHKLGLPGDQKVVGKMHIYLQRNHPEHYAKLLSERIL